ncbi:hypothetical protein RCL_jg3286.t1 [Rhizophagus clarus]|uniref:Uncharacterized protein n=1 Tax=Rhizophagus clarus TaxID=94130 RepID=A0A8H3M963_9GLOM|nr:hypothetical protein RCL_jg3286.t1 [Rhizophagus clarus]
MGRFLSYFLRRKVEDKPDQRNKLVNLPPYCKTSQTREMKNINLGIAKFESYQHSLKLVIENITNATQLSLKLWINQDLRD